jgi:transcriptional regulator with XRE-family HTH domain
LVGQLREAIQASGLSLYQLGIDSGVGRDRLSRFMRGQRDLTVEAADKLCQALGLELTTREGFEPSLPIASDPDASSTEPKRKRKKGEE